MKRLLLLLVLLPSPALAAVPSTMSYQGVLMDDAGVLVPDGDYSLTFKLYTVSAGGSAMWTETQNPVAVSRGGFSVILGSVTPLTGVTFDVPFWLGITVGGGTELLPRVQLASSPYGLSLRLPFSGAVSSSGSALTIANGGTGPAITADPLLTVGTPSRNGEVRIYGNGTTGMQVREVGGYGAGQYLYDESGHSTIAMEPDFNGTGGWLYVANGFYVDGNDGSGNPALLISGAGSESCLRTDVSGNEAVQLPASSISATEILDEPGIAQGFVHTGQVSIGSMGDIATVTLTSPTSGYIVVEADAGHFLGGSPTATDNWAYIQIDETAGGDTDPYHGLLSGYSSAAGTHDFVTHASVSCRRTYYKAAGTYTFRLEAWGQQNELLTNYFWNPTITATFYPSSYGAVTTAVASEESGQFTDVQRTSSAGQPRPEGGLQPAGSGESVLVDLRELELRDAEARAQAERAHRQLLEARLAQQKARAAMPATAKP